MIYEYIKSLILEYFDFYILNYVVLCLNYIYDFKVMVDFFKLIEI